LSVGNSLIDDKSVVDNAFVWEEEFPEVFEQGGFDVVIGNPPYLGGRDWKNKELVLNCIKKVKENLNKNHIFQKRKFLKVILKKMELIENI